MEHPPARSLLRDWLRRFGAAPVTAGVTLLAVLLSVLILGGISVVRNMPASMDALLLAFLAPAIVVPLLSYRGFAMLAQLDETERRLKILSTTDELTGAFNRRYFMDLALYELEHCARDEGELSIAIMDFDNFKLVNDRFGHLAGDQALREVSRICRETIRKTDIFARYGGDEFIFLFPRTPREAARECLQRISEKVSDLSFESGENIVAPRVSIGVHSYSLKSPTLDTILEKADLALYKSKQMGGSRVSW